MNGECEQHGTKTMDGTYRLFVAVLLGIICDCEHYLSMPANSGEPKAIIKLATSFVCTLLMNGRRGINLVPAAAQTALQSNYYWHQVSVLRYLQ